MGVPIPLDFLPGLQRDGTTLDANRALDALWTRWRLGRARKIGGYQDVFDFPIAGIPRKVHCFYTGANIYVHFGSTTGFWQVVLDQNGNYVSSDDRTPSEFPGTANLSWTIDAIFDTTSDAVQIVAHAAPSALLPANATPTTPYIGMITAVGALVPLSDPSPPSGTYTVPSISGGIVCVQPFLFDFDSNGLVQWSAPNLPEYLGTVGGTTGAGQARISAQKVVAGLALRGGGVQSPAALFWTLSEVVSCVFSGTPTWFTFNTVSPSSTILSQASFIEYDSLYFWMGIGRCLVFNGVVEEVPNTQNQDWFFNNLTPGYAAQTFALKFPRYGEIWWCAPMFGNTFPSHAIIYNLRENCWYDTELPQQLTAGFFAQGFQYPITVRPDGAGGTFVSLYDKGNDAVSVSGSAVAIRSYYETPWMGGPKNNPPDDSGLSKQQLEVDFVQSGDMFAYCLGAGNIRAPVQSGPQSPIPAAPSNPQQQFIGLKQGNRISKIHFESNILGGSYISGHHLLHADRSEKRQTSG